MHTRICQRRVFLFVSLNAPARGWKSASRCEIPFRAKRSRAESGSPHYRKSVDKYCFIGARGQEGEETVTFYETDGLTCVNVGVSSLMMMAGTYDRQLIRNSAGIR